MSDSTADDGEPDPLETYEELVAAGTPPDPVRFAAAYPQHPDLLRRIRSLDHLRGQLDEAARRLGSGPRPPATLGGFRLGEPLGKGGMAVVYLGEDTTSGARCALKLLRLGSLIAQRRFQREAELMRRLTHPGIARLIDFGVDGEHAFIATELVDGVTLRDLMEARAPLPPAGVNSSLPPRPRDAVALALQVAEALAHAHAQGVVHRDVKPSNIMVTHAGRAKLIDFGVALAARAPGERITRTGVFVGSHNYAAPEQLRGDKRAIGPWTDTYALGATLFEMLAGRPPFLAATFVARALEADAKPARGPRHYGADVPRALDKLALHALAPAVKKRFADGAVFAAALRAALR